MFRHYHLFLLFLSFPLLLSLETECQANPDLPNFLQDQIQLHNINLQKPNNYVYKYPMFMFPQLPKAFLSISSYKWKQFKNVDFWIDWTLDEKGLSLSFICFGMHWTFLKMNFWLIAREQLEFGFIVLENIENLSRKTVNINKKGEFFSTFLCIKTTLELMHFQVELSHDINDFIFLTVSAGQNTYIHKVRVDYLIYEKSFAPTCTKSYTLSLESQERYYQVIESDYFPLNYKMFGIKKIILLETNKLDFSIDIEEGHILSLFSSHDINRISFDFLSFGASNVCQNCNGKFIFHKRKTVCLSECPPETIKNPSNFICERCSALLNMKKSIFSDVCECQKGFIFHHSGQCKINQDSPFKSLAPCSDPHAKRNKNGQCQCEGSFYKDQFGNCQGFCFETNTYWNKQTDNCTCFPGFAEKNGQCVASKDCGKNKVLINGICECDSQTIWDKSHQNCIPCPSSMFKDGNECKPCQSGCSMCFSEGLCFVCQKDYQLQGQNCIFKGQFSLKMAQRSPVYTSPGIIIDMLINPPVKRTEREIYQMIDVDISEKQAQTQVYLSQDQKNFSSFRCFLHYEGQLPLIDFVVRIGVRWPQTGEEQSLSLFQSPITKSITSAVEMDEDDGDYIL